MEGEVNEVHEYYESCAKNYNSLRFKNSYGAFLHSQERKYLVKELDIKLVDKTLDLCCGTGRFMEFANYGVDQSNQMISEAKTEHPSKNYFVVDAEAIPFDDRSLNQVYCIHAIMHLSKDKTVKVLNEVNRVLVNQGILIIDFPSKRRRSIFKRKRHGWHGSNDYSIKELMTIVEPKWKLNSYQGILFFPIHRLPVWIRKYFAYVDSILCSSIFKEYSSYLIVTLEKK
jgi:ubiquinone/menaquinone biosynthesis C-methylase UbiE